MGAGAIPNEFVCPISGDVMRDPVWLSTGELECPPPCPGRLRRGSRHSRSRHSGTRLLPHAIPESAAAIQGDTIRLRAGLLVLQCCRRGVSLYVVPIAVSAAAS